MPTHDRPDRFGWQPGDLGYSQCIDCRHKHRTGPTCAAFPQGIPDAILRNQHDHRQPYAGDGGVTFAPEDDDAEEA